VTQAPTDPAAGVTRGSRVRTLFFGSGSFAVPILDAVAEAPELELVGVVSAPDRPAGRRGELTPVPATRRARELGVWLFQPSRLRAPDAVAEVVALAPELGVLADYGQIVPAAVLDVPRHGILNLHPSILPRHRGASPIQATIASGDREAGVTLMRMDEGLDTGPIVAVERWSLSGGETAPELEAEAARRAADLLRRSLRGWLDGSLATRPQPEDGVTLTRPLHREDGRLDILRPAVELARLVRANQPWPGSFVDTPLGRLIVHAAEVAPGDQGDQPGRVAADDDGLALTTPDGRLRLLRVQLAGRNATDAASLRRGAPGLVGATVGRGEALR
jgi:methionyl-tRNA formyltransferase